MYTKINLTKGILHNIWSALTTALTTVVLALIALMLTGSLWVTPVFNADSPHMLLEVAATPEPGEHVLVTPNGPSINTRILAPYTSIIERQHHVVLARSGSYVEKCGDALCENKGGVHTPILGVSPSVLNGVRSEVVPDGRYATFNTETGTIHTVPVGQIYGKLIAELPEYPPNILDGKQWSKDIRWLADSLTTTKNIKQELAQSGDAQ